VKCLRCGKEIPPDEAREIEKAGVEPYWLQQVRKLEERIEELEDVAFTVLRYLRANCASCDYSASFGSPSECNAGSCYAKEAYLLLSRVLGISDKF